MEARPLVAALKTWLQQTLVQVAGGSSIAQAIRYGLNHWDGLVRFLDDGRIEIDSNTASAACGRLRRDVHCAPFFKPLETLEFDFRHRCDTGDLFARARQ
jgi:hypothetical protein